MNSSRTMTVATIQLLVLSSGPAFSDDPARNPGGESRPATAHPRAQQTPPCQPDRRRRRRGYYRRLADLARGRRRH